MAVIKDKKQFMIIRFRHLFFKGLLKTKQSKVLKKELNLQDVVKMVQDLLLM